MPRREIDVLGSRATLDQAGVRRWTGADLLASRQRLSGVDDDRRLTRVMVVLCNRVHGVVGVGAFLMDTLYRAVTYGAAVMPSHFRTHWNCLERSFFRCSHSGSPACSTNPRSTQFPGSGEILVVTVGVRRPLNDNDARMTVWELQTIDIRQRAGLARDDSSCCATFAISLFMRVEPREQTSGRPRHLSFAAFDAYAIHMHHLASEPTGYGDKCDADNRKQHGSAHACVHRAGTADA